jgi:uncharacterized glyoxalase superfamily protein PhnB
MRPTPEGWPRLSTAVFYDDAPKAIDWLVAVFGFEVRIKVEVGGAIAHSELCYGTPETGLAVVMVASLSGRPGREHYASPRSVAGKNTQSLLVYVDDVDAHCAKARAAGAVIGTEPMIADYGPEYWADKNYEVIDLEGHHWWFAERLRGKTA